MDDEREKENKKTERKSSGPVLPPAQVETNGQEKKAQVKLKKRIENRKKERKKKTLAHKTSRLDEGEQQRKAATKRANAIFCMQSA
jgi:hypothetical protein